MWEKYTVKRHLAASLVALALCVAMLLGTTFAWFSDGAKTAANTVTAGNLHIALEYKTADGGWADAEGVDLFADSGADMSLWEPGMAVLSSAFRVRNTGTLALTYTLTATLEGESGLSEVIQMAVLGDADLEAAGVGGPRADAQRGPLVEYVEARGEGGFAPVGGFSQSGELLPGETGATDPQYILLYWKPNADEIDNRYNGTTDELSFHLDVRATQAPEESDSFGDGYDADASKPPVQKPATVAPKGGWADVTALQNTISKALTGKAYSYTTLTKLVFSNWDKYAEEVGGKYEDGLLFGAVPTDDQESTDHTGARIFYKEDVKELYILTKDPNVKIKAPESVSLLCQNTELLEADLSGLDTSGVEIFSKMCGQANHLTSIDLTGIDTSSATDFSDMFRNCQDLTNINLSGFNTSNVTTVDSMFTGCESLVTVDLHELNLSKCENFNNMFSSCEALSSVNMEGMHLTVATKISSIFSGCVNLTSVDLTPFTGAKIIGLSSAFKGCAKLTEVDLSMLDTSGLITIDNLFDGCTSLADINFGSNFNTSKVTSMIGVFRNCASLKELDISTFDTSLIVPDAGGRGADEMFRDCSQLVTIYASEKFSIPAGLCSNHDYDNMFRGCVSLVGGNGTRYNEKYYPSGNPQKPDADYARIDGLDGMEGYFTKK